MPPHLFQVSIPPLLSFFCCKQDFVNIFRYKETDGGKYAVQIDGPLRRLHQQLFIDALSHPLSSPSRHSQEGFLHSALSTCLEAYNSVSSAPSFPTTCTKTQAFCPFFSLTLTYFHRFSFFLHLFTSSLTLSPSLSLCSACMIQSDCATPRLCGPHWTGTGMSRFFFLH